jgi:hypothetical protein
VNSVRRGYVAAVCGDEREMYGRVGACGMVAGPLRDPPYGWVVDWPGAKGESLFASFSSEKEDAYLLERKASARSMVWAV